MEPLQIRTLREELGLSRASLAVFLGVVEITVQRWESGTGSAPHGLQLVVLRALERAAHNVGAERVGRLVRQGLCEQAEALRELLSLASGEQQTPPRRT